MSFNFNSTWHSNAPKQRLSLVSGYLLKELQNQRENVDWYLTATSNTTDNLQEGTADLPLIFIGHSFGGNVIEQVC